MAIEDVKRVKDYLVSTGEDLGGPCGAFKITKRVAGLVGSGVLSKPQGNNCEGFAVDQLCWPNGEIRDILIDAGGANTPQWGPGESIDPSRYVAVPRWSFPGETVPEPPGEVPGPDVDLTPILARIEALEASQAALGGVVGEILNQFGSGVREVLAKMVVRGSSSRNWGHAHQVELKIEEK